MVYQMNRHVIEIPDDSGNESSQLLDMDFFLYPENRKVILGTVRFPNGAPAPCAVVKFFKMKNGTNDPENTSEMEDLGHAITDDCGQFILGPVYPGDTLVLKIFYIDEIDLKEPSNPSRSTHAPEDN